ncbi:MAG: hypothetical protein LQ346_004170 [Caloplaca aetnensis]|nr:MAG: hypothetical protein LQ346_004170 [Caloplaca aetnensis]
MDSITYNANLDILFSDFRSSISIAAFGDGMTSSQELDQVVAAHGRNAIDIQMLDRHVGEYPQRTPMAVAPWAGPASCSSGAQSSPPSPTRERQGRQSGWRSSPLPSQPIVTVPGFKTDRVKKKGKGKAQFKKGGAKDATKPKKVKEKQEEEKLDEEQGQTSWRRGHEHRLSNC